MARSFRRRRSFGGRRKRPIDWVTTQEGWDLTSPPYVLDPGTIGIGNYTPGDQSIAILTAHQDIVGANQQPSMPQLEQTVVAVRGVITFGFPPFTPQQMPTVNMHLHLDLRIATAMQTPDAFFTTDLSVASAGVGGSYYDMSTDYVANDSFMWHEHYECVVSNSFWTESPGAPGDWRFPVRVPVNVAVQRRLQQREVLVLIMQLSASSVVGLGGVLVANNWADLRVWVNPQLRTLVRTIT